MCQPSAAPDSTVGFWRPGDDTKDVKGNNADLYHPDVYKLIEKKIGELDEELRELSLDIHGAFIVS